MKKILGLDLGTNSIGWALVNHDIDTKNGTIEGIGSRIIPMTQDVLGKFDSGVSISQTAERTGYRGVRRLHERQLLRRERLHRVLNILGFLPKHYAESIDFQKRFGQFKAETETKLVYKKDESGKHEFLFQESFNEMLIDFKENGLNGEKIPYDWTIYYLRKKGLTQKIQKEELTWLLLNFNQKRGYYQLRGEEAEEDKSKKEAFYTLKVVEVVEREKGKTGVWYNVVLENGWVYKRESKVSLNNWIGKYREFIVTTEINEDGTVKLNKDNEEKRSFRAPKEDDWGLVKIRTEQTINQSGKTVGNYIYDSLLQNPSQKINGKLVRTVERKFYKDELKQILSKQIEFHNELTNNNLYLNCINELYKNNQAHKNNIKNRGFDYLFLDDIIFYQRPLKSKISLISNCSLEFRSYSTPEGINNISPIKCIAKSHPLFQEFRLWQFIQNIKIFKKESANEIDVTSQFIGNEEDFVKLFEILNDKKDITQKQFLAIYKLREGENQYRWNFVEDKIYPCNETRAMFLTKSAKIEGIEAPFFNDKNSEDLWHILYSVSDKIEIESAINKFAKKHHLPDAFAKAFSKLPPYKNDYGSYSAKAIKKLLPLMRIGKYWDAKKIDEQTLKRIDNISTGEFNENIKKRVREKAINLTEIEHFQSLPLWLASYIVYDKHSEASDLAKWTNPNDIDLFLKNEFKQHSLRNPIVEQVITETLRVVKDIWQQYGQSKADFFDEIHIELGREMKNPAEKRKQMTDKISQNENTNLRIKALLDELKNDGIAEIRPFSPNQQEILKIYEEGIYSNESRKEELEGIDKIRKNSKPSHSEILRYKLWLEQGYISPYTGATIRLSELFTTKYQVEHIFPQSRFFDDSLTNKVICESEVNSLKDNQTAMEFIKNHHGEKVSLNGGGFVKIKEITDYEEHTKKYFSKNKTKLKNLLSEEIPESFINRQLNDSRYISKTIKMFLSKIVREIKDGELEQEATSKNVISLTGSITSQMKQDWGLNDVWNEIITPRFERLNTLTNSTDFGQWENKQGKRVFQTTVPDTISKGFSKKRIDHRHHALDALVIACITRTHINYLNNLNAKDDNDKSIKHELRNKICYKTKPDEKGNYKWLFHKPWESFTQMTRDQLLQTVISFKQNTRIINKTVNKFEKYEDGEKKQFTQTTGENWAIRKPMHKETVSGKVILDYVKVAKNKILTASRKTLDISFDEKTIAKITDSGIQKILIEHLEQEIYRNLIDDNGKNIPPNELAFNQEGLENLNKNIQQLNNGKNHQPIYKVRVWEESNRFPLGQTGNKKHKYVEAAQGTNLFFAVYINKNGERNFKTIPLNEAIERQKQKIGVAPEKDENGNLLIFTLSPNDLVYVPNEEERAESQLVNFEKLSKNQVGRIYKFVSCTSGEGHFVTNNYAKEIVSNENGSNNKNERILDFNENITIFDDKGKPVMIKSICWKLISNRLGKITKIQK